MSVMKSGRSFADLSQALRAAPLAIFFGYSSQKSSKEPLSIFFFGSFGTSPPPSGGEDVVSFGDGSADGSADGSTDGSVRGDTGATPPVTLGPPPRDVCDTPPCQNWLLALFEGNKVGV